MLRFVAISAGMICLTALQVPGQLRMPAQASAPPPRSVSSGSSGGGDFYEWHWSLGALARRTPVVTGQPYSADHVVESVSTMPDGTTLTHTMDAYRIYRDSEGRTRFERQPPMMTGPNGRTTRPNGRTFPAIAEIHDPVAGFTYILDMEAKVAHRVAMDPPGMAPGLAGRGSFAPNGVAPARPAAVPPRPQVAMPPLPPVATPGQVSSNAEDLGDQTIEGILAHGTRITFSMNPPPGRGGEPMVQVRETWHSAELNLDILVKTTGSSVSTQKFTNISRADPSILLFEPPVDFRLVDETGAGVAVMYFAQ